VPDNRIAAAFSIRSRGGEELAADNWRAEARYGSGSARPSPDRACARGTERPRSGRVRPRAPAPRAHAARVRRGRHGARVRTRPRTPHRRGSAGQECPSNLIALCTSKRRGRPGRWPQNDDGPLPRAPPADQADETTTRALSLTNRGGRVAKRGTARRTRLQQRPPWTGSRSRHVLEVGAPPAAGAVGEHRPGHRLRLRLRLRFRGQ
jgi:hypothetical protein